MTRLRLYHNANDIDKIRLISFVLSIGCGFMSLSAIDSGDIFRGNEAMT